MYRLATILHDWHTTVRYDPSSSSKVNDSHVIWNGVCHFVLVINCNLNPISHLFLFLSLWHIAGYMMHGLYRVQVFPYDLTLSYTTLDTDDSQTDGRTDDNSANSLTVTSTISWKAKPSSVQPAAISGVVGKRKYQWLKSLKRRILTC